MIKKIFSNIVLSILKLRYKLEVKGFDKLNLDKSKGTLFLPNHPAYIDPVILICLLGRKYTPGILVAENQMTTPIIKFVSHMFPFFTIPDVINARKKGKEAIQKTVQTLVSEIDEGRDLLLYPSGRIYRQNKEVVHGTSSVHTIINSAEKKPQIVLVRTKGLWGSTLSYGSKERKPGLGNREMFWFLSMIICNLIFFIPKRKVTIEFKLVDDFPYDYTKSRMNRYLEEYYNEIPEERTLVPYYFFKKKLLFGNTFARKISDYTTDLDIITSATHHAVYDHLTEITGVEEINDTMSLSMDLDMDSLQKVELIQRLDAEFGVTDANTDQLNTVGDALLYAQGELSLEDDEEFYKNESIHSDWFTQGDWSTKTQFHPVGNVLEGVVAQAKKTPFKQIMAEKGGGAKSYRDVIMGITVIGSFIEKMEGDYIGLMLPASTTASIAYLSIIAAGKIPVLINWTVGKRNIEHALNSLNVKHIITADKLIEKLEEQGLDVNELKDRFFILEELKSKVTTGLKIKAAYASYFNMESVLKNEINETAAVLFTSGSENLPKTVPLTHQNLLNNIDGISKNISVYTKDKMLGILPPFHSFGLTVTVVYPLVSGFSVVYHAVPTQAKVIAGVIEKFRATILVATPTFLANILRRTEASDVSSLRVAVVGAEKCPKPVFEKAQEICHGIEIMEGYGITECSPVLAVNPHGSSVLGTVGKILPNIEYVFTDPDNPSQVKEDTSTPSMLLVRGPSVFKGYLNYDGESPFISVNDKLFYKTGDLVIQDKDGYITFSGRLKRFIKIGGEMVSLPAIEEELQKHYKAEEGVTLAIEARENDGRPEIILFSTVKVKRSEINTILKEAGFSGLSNIRDVIMLDEIPVLGTGKTDYRALKDKL